MITICHIFKGGLISDLVSVLLLLTLHHQREESSPVSNYATIPSGFYLFATCEKSIGWVRCEDLPHPSCSKVSVETVVFT